MREQRIPDGLAEEKIAEVFGRCRRAGKWYRKGVLTEDSYRQEILRGVFGVFMSFFTDNGLKLRLDGENYPCFAREYPEYRNGRGPADRVHLPWLYDVTEGTREASAEDQRQFFRMMEAFGLTPEYFEPLPAGVQAPDTVPVHRYNSAAVYGVRFRCADDGGLLVDEDPVGKTFRLLSDTGTEAVVTIKEDRRNAGRNGMDFDELVTPAEGGLIVAMAEFLAEGYIEGYTARENRSKPDILIRLKDGGRKIYWLAYWEDGGDEKARMDYPEWREYYAWCEKKEIERAGILAPLFERFIRVSDDA